MFLLLPTCFLFSKAQKWFFVINQTFEVSIWHEEIFFELAHGRAMYKSDSLTSIKILDI